MPLLERPPGRRYQRASTVRKGRPPMSTMSTMTDFQHHAARAGAATPLDIQRASDFQPALLGMVGHDLRQPLQVIQSAYEWLATRIETECEKARLARGERAIARLTEQLDRLVGALRLYEHSKTMEISEV